MYALEPFQKTTRPDNVIRSRKQSKKPLGRENDPKYFINLHQTLGNQFVQRMLLNNTEIRGNKTGHLVSGNNSHYLYNNSLKYLTSIPIQAKLTINQPGDVYEQETDRLADKVMRMPENGLAQQDCLECDEEEKLRRKPLASFIQKKGIDRGMLASESISNQIKYSKGSGQPLPKTIRSFMESRFGMDFSNVKVHSNEKAVQMTQDLNAKAFTHGLDIYFNKEQYNPESSEGTRLLGHELTHVIQQNPKGSSASIANKLTHGIKQSKDATGAAMVQRAGDPTQAPPMNCELATSTPASVVQEILFAQNSAVVPASDVLALQYITAGWVLNGSPEVRIDGYASVEGSQPHNWTLSCQRAEAIKSILTSTPQGIPANRIQIVAHGEGEDAGAQRPANRRASVNLQFPMSTPTPAPTPEPTTPSGPVCGTDVSNSLTTMLGTVGPWFRGLPTFHKHRSCAALGPGAPLVGVNPVMAWDTRELFLPNTGWLDSYFLSHSCGSPRNPRCATDPTRHLCETAGTCGNSLVVGGKCMLAGTANYALFGKMCRLCHDETSQWGRWDMRAIIRAWKAIDGDDPTPPMEMASAAYDGTFPTVPAAAENRGSCTGRCGQTHSGAFNFIWEPYKPR